MARALRFHEALGTAVPALRGVIQPLSFRATPTVTSDCSWMQTKPSWKSTPENRGARWIAAAESFPASDGLHHSRR